MDALAQVREDLRKQAPDLSAIFYDELVPKAFSGATSPTQPKIINDPIWKSINLQRWEVAALDLPLMQRLRRVRQLGLAHVVYPSAQHTRFEHSLGALAAATEVFDALIRRANLSGERVKRFGNPSAWPRWFTTVGMAPSVMLASAF